jgi:hypothetical protein
LFQWENKIGTAIKRRRKFGKSWNQGGYNDNQENNLGGDSTVSYELCATITG